MTAQITYEFIALLIPTSQTTSTFQYAQIIQTKLISKFNTVQSQQYIYPNNQIDLRQLDDFDSAIFVVRINSRTKCGGSVAGMLSKELQIYTI